MARMGSPYDGPVASGFEQQAMRSGYQCLVGCLHSDHVEAAGYIDEFMGHGVEGLLLCTVWNHPSLKEALRSVVEAKMPLVFVDYAWDGVTAPLVCGDHFAGGRLIGEHLMQTGHRAIAIVENEHASRVPSVESRISAVCEVAQEHGAEVHTVHLPAGSRKHVGAHLARFLGHQPDVTALVCCNDVEAYGVILALNACGLAVPGDVAVTGYDDLTAALVEEIGMADHECDAIMSTPVTTVRQPLRRIGEEAARLLIDCTERGVLHREERRILDVELVVRASSRLPAGATC